MDQRQLGFVSVESDDAERLGRSSSRGDESSRPESIS